MTPPDKKSIRRWFKQFRETGNAERTFSWVAQTTKLRFGSSSAGIHMEPQEVQLLSKWSYKDAPKLYTEFFGGACI